MKVRILQWNIGSSEVSHSFWRNWNADGCDSSSQVCIICKRMGIHSRKQRFCFIASPPWLVPERLFDFS